MGKDALSTKVVGEHPDRVLVIDELGPCSRGLRYSKDCDLRYGTNPSQTAALYGPEGGSFLSTLRMLKSGKEGASQTNMEDIFYAALTAGYFEEPTAIIMKHENPSGFATQYRGEALVTIFRKAFDSDFRAAFGGTVLMNRQIDSETTEAMRENFVEVVVAPGFDEGVVEKLKTTADGKKTSTRIFEYDDHAYRMMPRFTGDRCEPELKRLPDGSLIRSDVLLSPIRNAEELKQYVASKRQPTETELRDALTGYRIRLRSNSVRLVKNGYTTGLGTGQQDRVMCIDTAAYKNRKLAELAAREGKSRAADYDIAGSVLVSDGFFPFTDSIELAHDLGVTAVLAPHGGAKFGEVLAKADEYGMAFIDLPDKARFFDHH